MKQNGSRETSCEEGRGNPECGFCAGSLIKISFIHVFETFKKDGNDMKVTAHGSPMD